MRIKLLLLSLVLFTIQSYATSPLDSLRQSLKAAPSDSEKSKIHQQIALYWVTAQQQDSVKKHMDSMLALAEKGSSDFLVEQITNANNILFGIGDFNQAGNLNHKYLQKFEKNNNKPGLAACYFNLGRIELFTGNISEAEKLLSKAHSLADEKSTLKSAASISLGGIYSR